MQTGALGVQLAHDVLGGQRDVLDHLTEAFHRQAVGPIVLVQAQPGRISRLEPKAQRALDGRGILHLRQRVAHGIQVFGIQLGV